MHPFWAVTRMDEHKLEKERADATAKKVPEQLRPRFNVTIDHHECPVIFIGRRHRQPVTTRQTVSVPFLTNNAEILRGEELILKISAPKPKAVAKKALNWKQQRKQHLSTPTKKVGGAQPGNTFNLGGNGNPHPVVRRGPR